MATNLLGSIKSRFCQEMLSFWKKEVFLELNYQAQHRARKQSKWPYAEDAGFWSVLLLDCD